VSKTSVADVEQYIRNQKLHHQAVSFEQEYVAMLRKTGWEGRPEDLFG
jgi:hypothetical protein